MDKTIRKEIAGNRLKEVMKAKGVTNSELCNRLLSKYSIDYQEQRISMMRNGHRPISFENASMIADCLGIDPNYLLGKDDFRAESYQDYLEKEKSQKGFKKAIQQMSQYDSLIEPYGYYVKACFADGPAGSNVTTYQIHHNEHMANIPDNEMKQFKKDVDAFIRLKMDALMDRYHFDPEPLIEMYEEALANGEVIDLTNKPDQNGK